MTDGLHHAAWHSPMHLSKTRRNPVRGPRVSHSSGSIYGCDFVPRSAPAELTSSSSQSRSRTYPRYARHRDSASASPSIRWAASVVRDGRKLSCSGTRMSIAESSTGLSPRQQTIEGISTCVRFRLLVSLWLGFKIAGVPRGYIHLHGFACLNLGVEFIESWNALMVRVHSAVGLGSRVCKVGAIKGLGFRV